MWIKWIGLVGAGFASGMVVSGGVFALLIALGVISKLAYRTNTASWILVYEHVISLGAIGGGCYELFPWKLPMGGWGLGFLGLFFGIFVGAWIMSLAEIIDTIPIFMRRVSLKKGLALLVTAMALGHTAGMILYGIH